VCEPNRFVTPRNEMMASGIAGGAAGDGAAGDVASAIGTAGGGSRPTTAAIVSSVTVGRGLAVLAIS
jgi:hypothetical protein